MEVRVADGPTRISCHARIRLWRRNHGSFRDSYVA
jgi:hypothetical protein